MKQTRDITLAGGVPPRAELNREIRARALREARTAAAVAADNGGYARLSSLALQRIVYALTENEHQRVPATSEDTADGERGF